MNNKQKCIRSYKLYEIYEKYARIRTKVPGALQLTALATPVEKREDLGSADLVEIGHHACAAGMQRIMRGRGQVHRPAHGERTQSRVDSKRRAEGASGLGERGRTRVMCGVACVRRAHRASAVATASRSTLTHSDRTPRQLTTASLRERRRDAADVRASAPPAGWG